MVVVVLSSSCFLIFVLYKSTFQSLLNFALMVVAKEASDFLADMHVVLHFSLKK